MINKFPPQAQTASATRLEAPLRILIIEESAEVCADIRRMLLRDSDWRYRFTEVYLGAAGVRACREAGGDSMPDCVLLGYHLPDMNAVEVLAQLCNQSELPPCPVVVLTGSSDRIGNSVLRAGAQEYIGKSWLTPETLSRAIEDAIERFNLMAERCRAERKLRESEDGEKFARMRGAVGANITDRPGPEEARQEITTRYERQSRLLDATLSAITDFAYIPDLEGRFRYANKALLNLWGLTLEEAVGKNFCDLNYSDSLAAKLQGQIQQVVATGEQLSDETFYTNPAGVVGYSCPRDGRNGRGGCGFYKKHHGT
jgi:PAS domain S-box-containing protein